MLRPADLRLALRTATRQPIRTGASVLTLAVGLGITIAALSIIDTLLLHPYRFPDLSRLMIVRDSGAQSGVHVTGPLAVADFLDLQRQSRAFDGLAGWRVRVVDLGGATDPEVVVAVAVTGTFFDELGVKSTMGRTLAPGDDRAGRDAVAVITERFWRAKLGGQPGVVGQVVRLNGHPTTIVGVIATKDSYPVGIDVWVPLAFSATDEADRTAQPLHVVGRLRSGVTSRAALGELDAIAAELGRRFPGTNRGRGFGLLPVRQEQYEYTAALFLVLQGAALLVLLLGIANVSHWSIARAIDRRHEFRVRLALGASRSQVFWLVLGESLIIAAAAGAGALLLADWAISLIRTGLPEGIARWVAGWYSIHINGVIAACAALGALLTGVVLGVATAWPALASASTASLRDGDRTSTAGSRWLRRGLLAGEVFLMVVLLLCAVVMLRGFGEVTKIYAALGPDRLLSFSVSMPEWRYPADADVIAAQARTLDALGSLPGVRMAALIRNPPASNVPTPQTPVKVEGRPIPLPADAPRADVQIVSPATFATLGVSIQAGRPFRNTDGASGAPVAIVSREFARRFFPAQDPLGQHVAFSLEAGAPWIAIVGVADDVKGNWFDPEIHAVIYRPAAQVATRQLDVLVRTAGDPLQLAGAARAAVRRAEPQVATTTPQPFTDSIDDSLSPVRIIGVLLLLCGLLAALLAAVGVNAVLVHWVTAQTRELGIRVALGAGSARLLRLVLIDAGRFTAIGILLAAPAAVFVIHTAGPSLFGPATADAWTIGTVAAGAFALALGAAAGPARRALRINPVMLLRLE